MKRRLAWLLCAVMFLNLLPVHSFVLAEPVARESAVLRFEKEAYGHGEVFRPTLVYSNPEASATIEVHVVRTPGDGVVFDDLSDENFLSYDVLSGTIQALPLHQYKVLDDIQASSVELTFKVIINSEGSSREIQLEKPLSIHHAYVNQADEGSDTHTPTCACGLFTEPEAHQWQAQPNDHQPEGQYAHDLSCTGCDAKRQDACTFEVQVTPPTCAQGGHTQHTCTVCGQFFRDQETAATGEHQVDSWTQNLDNTAENAHHSGSCSTCNQAITLPCSFDEGSVTAPSCTGEGYTTHTCSQCQYAYLTDQVTALGHDYADWAPVEGSDPEQPQHAGTCSRCNETTVADCSLAAGEPVPATCTEQGYTPHTCEACGYTHRESLTELEDHSWGAWTPLADNLGTHRRSCSVCGEEEDAECNYVQGETHNPTCGEPGYITQTCETCAHTYQEPLAKLEDHSWGAWTPLADSPGTHRRSCSVCDEEEDAECYYVEGETRNPTCGEPGYITHICETCAHTYQEPLAKLEDHSWSAWTPLADSPGTHRRSCAVCGEEEDAACNYTEGETTAPTCNEQGHTTYSCPDCGHAEQGDFTEPTGNHSMNWGDMGNGQHQGVCSVCGITDLGFHDYSWEPSDDGAHKGSCAVCDASTQLEQLGCDITLSGDSFSPGETVSASWVLQGGQPPYAITACYWLIPGEEGAISIDVDVSALEDSATSLELSTALPGEASFHIAFSDSLGGSGQQSAPFNISATSVIPVEFKDSQHEVTLYLQGNTSYVSLGIVELAHDLTAQGTPEWYLAIPDQNLLSNAHINYFDAASCQLYCDSLQAAGTAQLELTCTLGEDSASIHVIVHVSDEALPSQLTMPSLLEGQVGQTLHIPKPVVQTEGTGFDTNNFGFTLGFSSSEVMYEPSGDGYDLTFSQPGYYEGTATMAYANIDLHKPFTLQVRDEEGGLPAFVFQFNCTEIRETMYLHADNSHAKYIEVRVTNDTSMLEGTPSWRLLDITGDAVSRLRLEDKTDHSCHLVYEDALVLGATEATLEYQIGSTTGSIPIRIEVLGDSLPTAIDMPGSYEGKTDTVFQIPRPGLLPEDADLGPEAFYFQLYDPNGLGHATISGESDTGYTVQFSQMGLHLLYAQMSYDSIILTKQLVFRITDEMGEIPSFVPVAEIEMAQEPQPLSLGEPHWLYVNVIPENASLSALAWSSSNPQVAKVDQDGKIRPMSLGSATITASALDGSGVSASREVQVYAPANLEVNVPDTVKAGEDITATWSLTGVVGEAVLQNVYWQLQEEEEGQFVHLPSVEQDGSSTATPLYGVRGNVNVSMSDDSGRWFSVTKEFAITDAPDPLNLSLTAPQSVAAGEIASVSWEITGGLEPYTVNSVIWYLAEEEDGDFFTHPSEPQENSATLRISYGVKGRVEVQISDATGRLVVKDQDFTITGSPLPLAASLQLQPSQVQVGEAVTASWTFENAVEPVTYSCEWQMFRNETHVFSEAGTINGSESTYTPVYGDQGVFVLQVSDGLGRTKQLTSSFTIEGASNPILFPEATREMTWYWRGDVSGRTLTHVQLLMDLAYLDGEVSWNLETLSGQSVEGLRLEAEGTSFCTIEYDRLASPGDTVCRLTCSQGEYSASMEIIVHVSDAALPEIAYDKFHHAQVGETLLLSRPGLLQAGDDFDIDRFNYSFYIPLLDTSGTGMGDGYAFQFAEPGYYAAHLYMNCANISLFKHLLVIVKDEQGNLPPLPYFADPAMIQHTFYLKSGVTNGWDQYIFVQGELDWVEGEDLWTLENLEGNAVEGFRIMGQSGIMCHIGFDQVLGVGTTRADLVCSLAGAQLRIPITFQVSDSDIPTELVVDTCKYDAVLNQAVTVARPRVNTEGTDFDSGMFNFSLSIHGEADANGDGTEDYDIQGSSGDGYAVTFNQPGYYHGAVLMHLDSILLTQNILFAVADPDGYIPGNPFSINMESVEHTAYLKASTASWEHGNFFITPDLGWLGTPVWNMTNIQGDAVSNLRITSLFDNHACNIGYDEALKAGVTTADLVCTLGDFSATARIAITVSDAAVPTSMDIETMYTATAGDSITLSKPALLPPGTSMPDEGFSFSLEDPSGISHYEETDDGCKIRFDNPGYYRVFAVMSYNGYQVRQELLFKISDENGILPSPLVFNKDSIHETVYLKGTQRAYSIDTIHLIHHFEWMENPTWELVIDQGANLIRSLRIHQYEENPDHCWLRMDSAAGEGQVTGRVICRAGEHEAVIPFTIQVLGGEVPWDLQPASRLINCMLNDTIVIPRPALLPPGTGLETADFQFDAGWSAAYLQEHIHSGIRLTMREAGIHKVPVSLSLKNIYLSEELTVFVQNADNSLTAPVFCSFDLHRLVGENRVPLGMEEEVKAGEDQVVATWHITGDEQPYTILHYGWNIKERGNEDRPEGGVWTQFTQDEETGSSLPFTPATGELGYFFIRLKDQAGQEHHFRSRVFKINSPYPAIQCTLNLSVRRAGQEDFTPLNPDVAVQAGQDTVRTSWQLSGGSGQLKVHGYWYALEGNSYVTSGSITGGHVPEGHHDFPIKIGTKAFCNIHVEDLVTGAYHTYQTPEFQIEGAVIPICEITLTKLEEGSWQPIGDSLRAGQEVKAAWTFANMEGYTITNCAWNVYEGNNGYGAIAQWDPDSFTSTSIYRAGEKGAFQIDVQDPEGLHRSFSTELFELTGTAPSLACSITLDKTEVDYGTGPDNQVTASWTISGGTPPYELNYHWIVTEGQEHGREMGSGTWRGTEEAPGQGSAIFRPKAGDRAFLSLNITDADGITRHFYSRHFNILGAPRPLACDITLSQNDSALAPGAGVQAGIALAASVTWMRGDEVVAFPETYKIIEKYWEIEKDNTHYHLGHNQSSFAPMMDGNLRFVMAVLDDSGIHRNYYSESHRVTGAPAPLEVAFTLQPQDVDLGSQGAEVRASYAVTGRQNARFTLQTYLQVLENGNYHSDFYDVSSWQTTGLEGRYESSLAFVPVSGTRGQVHVYLQDLDTGISNTFVSDSFGITGAPAPITCTITLNNPLVVLDDADTSNDQLSASWEISGGTAPYRVDESWLVHEHEDHTGQSLYLKGKYHEMIESGTSQSEAFVPSFGQSGYLALTVTDANGTSRWFSSDNFQIKGAAQPISGSIAISGLDGEGRLNLEEGGEVTASWNIQGGTPPYTVKYHYWNICEDEFTWISDGWTSYEGEGIPQPESAETSHALKTGKRASFELCVEDAKGASRWISSESFDIINAPAPLQCQELQVRAAGQEVLLGEPVTASFTLSGGQLPEGGAYHVEYWWAVQDRHPWQEVIHSGFAAVPAGESFSTSFVPTYGKLLAFSIQVTDASGIVRHFSASGLHLPAAGSQLFIFDDESGAIVGLTEEGKAQSSLVIPAMINDRQVNAIGAAAFAGSSASRILLSEFVGDAQAALRAAPSLTAVQVVSGNPAYSAVDGVLFSKDGSALYLYPRGKAGSSYTLPNGCLYIEASAFAGSELQSISLPASLASIGAHAFSSSGLQAISLPASFSSLDPTAFSGCNALAAYRVAAGNTEYSAVDGVLLNKLGSSLLAYPNGKAGVFYQLPASVTSVAAGAFAGNSNLRHIYSPNQGTGIPSDAVSVDQHVYLPGNSIQAKVGVDVNLPVYLDLEGTGHVFFLTDENLASVDERGILTPLKAGSALVCIRDQEGLKIACPLAVSADFTMVEGQEPDPDGTGQAMGLMSLAQDAAISLKSKSLAPTRRSMSLFGRGPETPPANPRFVLSLVRNAEGQFNPATLTINLQGQEGGVIEEVAWRLDSAENSPFTMEGVPQGSSCTLRASGLGYGKITAEVTLEGQTTEITEWLWAKEKPFTLRLYDDAILLDSLELLYNDPLSLTIPYKKGHSFVAWQQGSETAPAVMPAQDLDLYASFSKNRYTVQYKNGDTLLNTSSWEYGEAIDANAQPDEPVREGYDFQRWSGSLPDTMPDRDLVFQAIWEARTYKLTLNANGGKFSNDKALAEKILACGAPVNLKDLVPTRPDHDFDGWDSPLEHMPAKDLALNAKWKRRQVSISFDPNGGTLSSVPGNTSYEIGATLQAPVANREGHAFVKWEPEVPLVVPSSEKPIVYKAVWMAKLYQLVLDLGDGTQDTKEIPFNSPIVPPQAPVRAGYLFKGWLPPVFPASMPAGDLRYTAQWEKAPDEASDISSLDIEIGEPDGGWVYTGEAIEPAITIRDGEKTLVQGTDFTADYSSNVNAGEASVTITGIGAYQGEVEVKFTILRAQGSVTSVHNPEKTYDKNAVADPEVDKTGDGGLSYAYYLVEGENATPVEGKPVDVGVYKLVVTLSESTNYTGASTEISFAINPITASIEWSGTTPRDYDGQPSDVTAVVSNLVEGDDCIATIEGGAAKNAGTHTAIATGLDNPNYKLPEPAPSQGYTISPKAVRLDWTGTESRTYDGNASNVMAGVLDLVQNDVCTVKVDGGTEKKAGTHTATAHTLSNKNYKLLDPKPTADYIIQPREVTLSWSGTATREYDGQLSDVAAVVSNLVSGDTCAVAVSGGTEKNAGTHTAKATGLDNTNYKLPEPAPTQSYTINPKAVRLDWTGAESRIYDGNASNVMAGVLDLVQNDVCTVKVDGGTEKKAGTHTATAHTLSNSNYRLPDDVTRTYTIEQRTAQIRWSNTASRVYDGSASNVTAAVSNLVSGDTCAVAVSGGTEKNAGTHTAKATGLDNTNYKLSEPAPTQSYIINPKVAVIVWSDHEGLVYNGTASNVKATAVDKDTGFIEELGVINGIQMDAGEYTAEISSAELQDKNYVLSAEGHSQPYTISPLEVSLTWSGTTTRDYDGEPSCVTAAVSNLVDGDTCDAEITGGKEVNAGTHTATADKLSNNNYKLPDPKPTANYIIQPREVTLTWSGTTTREYDGQLSDVAAVVSNLVSDDTCAVAVSGGTEKNAGIHTAKATGLDNTNYKLPEPAPSQSYIINPKVAVIVWSDHEGLVYNGTASNVKAAAVDKDTGFIEELGVINGIQMDAGEYTAMISSAELQDKNYVLTAEGHSQPYTISPLEVTLTWSGTAAREYDREPSCVIAAVSNLVDGDACDVEVTGGKEANASTHTATADKLSNNNYKLPDPKPTANYTIQPREVTLTWSGTAARDYDGQPSKVTAVVSNLVDVDNCTVAIEGGTEKNAGTHTAKATGLGNTNYKLPAIPPSQSYTINPKVVHLDWTGVEDRIYDGNASNVMAGVLDLVQNDVCTVKVDGGTEKKAGTHTATAHTLSNNNYRLPDDVTRTYTIEQRTAQIRWSNTASRVYDGSASNVTAEVSNRAPGDTCTLTIEGGAAKNAGTHTAKAISLGNLNYKLQDDKPAADYVITAKEVTLTWSGTTARNYDGTASNVWAAVSNLVEGDDCTVTIEGGAAKDAGIHTAKATGLGNTNYKLPAIPPSQSYTINPKAVRLDWTGAESRIYDGNASNVMVGVLDLVQNDVCTVKVDGGTEKKAGTHTATAHTLSNNNYRLPDDVTRTYTIEQRTAQIQWSNTASHVYDGSASNVTAAVSNLVDGDTCTVTIEGGAAKNAGTHTAKATGLGNTNYKLPVDQPAVQYVIGPREAILAWAGTETRAYDGQPSNVTAAVSNLVDGDTCTVLVSGGTEKNAGAHTAKATGLGNTNYRLPAVPPSQSYTINPKVVSIVWSGYTKRNYDGSASQVTAKALDSASGFSQDLAVRGGTAKDAGNHIASLESTTLANQNYALPASGTSQAYTILPRVASLTWSGITTRDYNGQPSKVAAMVSNLVDGDACTVTLAGGLEKTAGTHTATASSLSNTNYKLPATAPTKAYTIKPLTIGLAWSGFETREYNGTASRVTATATGLIMGDACKVTVTGGGEKAVGKHTAKATGLDNSNYLLPAGALSQAYEITPALVESIDLEAGEITLNVGESKAVKVLQVLPDYAGNKALAWSVSDPAVAAIDQTGLLTAMKAGTAMVTAQAQDGSSRKAACQITVLQPVTKIILEPEELEMEPDDVQQLKALVSPDDASDAGLIWTSSDPTIAGVSETGEVTALQAGEVIITARAADGSDVSAQCRLVVKQPALPGDANDDDEVDTEDLISIVDFLVKRIPLGSEENANLAGGDGDVEINIDDLILLIDFLVGS